MDRPELIRRLKGARALGGYTKPKALADQPLMVENGIKESRIRELESMRGRADARPMELDVIARACGLPPEFFSAPFARLARQKALDEQMAGLERKLDELLERAPDLETLRREAARQVSEDAAAAGIQPVVDPRRQG